MVIRNESVHVSPAVWNSQIFDEDLKTQNYDKGFERFVRKFDPEVETEAVIAIVKGDHFEHGTAVCVIQEKRRCLLLDTVYGLTDEEALWHTLLAWAKFQSRLKRPRQEPGQLFYPAVYSHVFEKYWQTIDHPEQHSEFSQETSFTQACATRFSAALGDIDTSAFTPLVDSEANPFFVGIAQEAAISRLCPIRDALDFWALDEGRGSSVGRSSPDTGSGGSAPG
jgi:hypothetical protein